MKWIGQNIYDQVSKFRSTVDFSEDVTFYQPVNNANPEISLGSSAANRLEIKSTYNSGTQTLCDIDFTTYTASGTTNDGRFNFYVDEVLKVVINDASLITSGNGIFIDDGCNIAIQNTKASSATEGGKLRLMADDGAAMADNHRLGVIEFHGAEDASGTDTIGARIEAMCDAAWSASENGARLDFYTTDGNASESKVLTLDSDKLATFTGAVTVTGALTGTLATATQPNITTLGTIGTGTWQGTRIASTHLDGDTAHLTTDQTFTGNKTFDETIIGNINGSSGSCTGQSATVATIAGLAPNTAPTGSFVLPATAAGQANITTLAGLTSFGAPGATTTILAGNVHALNPVDDGNPIFIFGASTTEMFKIHTSYFSGGQVLSHVVFSTSTGSTTAQAGSMLFNVDDSNSLTIDDNGISIAASKAIRCNSVNILSDSSGTMTLSNIDAIDTVTKATIKKSNIGGNGNYIKLLPDDFSTNADGGNSKFGVGYVNTAGTGYGMKVPNDDTELFAFVDIPEGMKATHVEIFGKRARGIEVFEVQINANTMVSKGTGNCNTELSITNVDATATNLLAIEVDTASVSADRVYGGRIKIAAQ